MISTCALALLISMAGLLSGCKEPTPRDQQVEGKAFNPFFPASQDGYSVIFTSEKKGYSQANIKKGDVEVATMAVSDLIDDAEAVRKFEGATDSILSFPVISRGENGTAVLIANRFQIVLRSTSEEFSAEDRRKWISSLDLASIAALK
ncbi:MAG: hypothetical protein LR011_12720 [Verrucomicrobia bacterium]|nr:hypothetical protein [Verrucomicrobiota bacterium]